MHTAGATATAPATDRLLITACLAGSGGGEVALLRHLRYSTVPKERLTVAVLNDGPLIQAVRDMGIRCEMLGRPGRDGFYPGPGERLQAAWRLASLLRQTRTRSVLAFGMHDLLVALWARRLRSFHLSWRSQGEFSILGASLPPDAEARHLVSRVERGVDMVVPTTAWDRATLTKWGVSATRLKTVYLGVDDEWFDVAAVEDHAPVRLLMSGRLVRWKGQDTLVAALAILAARGIACHTWIVGDGDPVFRSELEAAVTGAGLADRVSFIGHRENVRELMAQCQIAVHCSAREPFGLVVVEAMAAGLAVVASDVQGPREIITPGVDGLLVTPQAPDRLAEALQSLIEQPAQRRLLAERGRQTAHRRFRASLNVPAAEVAAFGLPAGVSDRAAHAVEGRV